MAADRIGPVVQQLRRAVLGPEAADMTDRQLLEAFIGRRDEAAFGAIVRRHGPLVWGVCRRLLGDHHGAEDAFQATFLVLVRKASSLARRELLANWLYGVAYQVSRKARALANRRRAREKQVEPMPEPQAREQEPRDDVLPQLDRELNGLPEKYRRAILLCDLMGKTQKDAAAELGVPEGTLSARLSRGRALLARRLSQRGVVLPAVAVALWAQNASAAALPAPVVTSTLKAAGLWVAGTTVGANAARVTLLAEGVLRSMLLTKLKRLVALVAAFFAITGLGLAVLGAGGGQGPAANQKEPLAAEKPEEKPGPAPAGEIKKTTHQNEGALPKKSSSSPVLLGSTTWRFASTVMAMAYTKDGQLLVIAEGPFVHVLEAKTGKEIRTFKAQDYHVNSMALAGDKVAVTGGDLKSHVWDFKQAKKLLSFPSHKNGSQNLRFSPDGKYLSATGDDVGREDLVLVYTDYSVRVWDAATGKELPPFAGGLKTGTVGVFSPDSKQFAWAGYKGVRLCHVADGKEVFHYQSDGASDLAFSPDGQLLACATSKGIAILDAKTGKEQVVCQRQHQEPGIPNYRLAFAPQGDTLASCGEDGNVLLWDVATGKERAKLPNWPSGSPSGWINAIAFSPDGKTLAVAPQDQTIRLWDPDAKKQINDLEKNRPVVGVAITPDGKSVITEHQDGKLRWWEAATGKQLHVEKDAFTSHLLGLSKDGSKLHSIEGGKFLCWDVTTRKLLPSPFKPLIESSLTMALSPDERTLATGSMLGPMSLWDLKAGKSTKLAGHKGEVLSLAFTADGKYLLSGSGMVIPTKPVSQPEFDNTIKLWDVEQGKEIRVIAKAPAKVESLAVSPDGKLVVSNAIFSDWTGIPMWDVTTGKEVRRIGPYGGFPTKVAFAPHGKWLAIARWQFSPDFQGTVVLLDTATWKEVTTLRGHLHRIHALAFTPDGRYLVTGSEDCSALVWDLSELGK